MKLLNLITVHHIKGVFEGYSGMIFNITPIKDMFSMGELHIVSNL